MLLLYLFGLRQGLLRGSLRGTRRPTLNANSGRNFTLFEAHGTKQTTTYLGLAPASI